VHGGVHGRCIIMVRLNVKKRRSPKTMAEALDFLLYDIGVDLGFCLPPKDHVRICSAEFWDADSFTDEVFRVEGMNPDELLEGKRQIHRRFTEMFESSSVDSESFQPSQQCEP
jgi:hypothetical protein